MAPRGPEDDDTCSSVTQRVHLSSIGDGKMSFTVPFILLTVLSVDTNLSHDKVRFSVFCSLLACFLFSIFLFLFFFLFLFLFFFFFFFFTSVFSSSFQYCSPSSLMFLSTVLVSVLCRNVEAFCIRVPTSPFGEYVLLALHLLFVLKSAHIARRLSRRHTTLGLHSIYIGGQGNTPRFSFSSC